MSQSAEPQKDKRTVLEGRTMYTDIEYERIGNAGVIRLNRPDKLNALTYHTLGELKSAISAAVDDSGVIGIVITGKGRGFCAGLDSAVLAQVTQDANDGARDETEKTHQINCLACSLIC